MSLALVFNSCVLVAWERTGLHFTLVFSHAPLSSPVLATSPYWFCSDFFN